MSAIIFGMKKGLYFGPNSFPVSAYAPASSSKVWIPPIPTPKTTPIRSLFTASKSMPESSTAILAAAKAYWVYKSILRASLRSM